MTKAIRRALANRARGEAGFTLIEVIVAMVITLIVMTSLSYVVVSALKTIQQGKQRQTATALATERIEQLRAMPYDTVTTDTVTAPEAGILYVATSAGVTKFNPPAALVPGLPSGGELLVRNAQSGQWDQIAVDGVKYRIHSYVTKPAPTASGSQTYNLTVIAQWTSNVWPSGRMAVQRTTTFTPGGCLSSVTAPYAAPCQAYVTARAGDVQAGLSVASAEDPATSPWLLDESGVQQLQLAFPAAGSTFYVEQTATGAASALTTASTILTDSDVTTTGGQAAKAAVDSDPSSAPNQTVNVTSAAHTTGTATVDDNLGANSRGRLILTQGGNDLGHARAAIGADSTICRGLGDTALQTGTPARPCSSSDMQPGGTGSKLVYQSPLGGGDVTLAAFAPNGLSRSVSGVFGQASGTVCSGPLATGVTKVDCVHAAAQRSLGASGFPVSSNVVNAGFPTAPVAFDDNGDGVLPTLSPTAAFSTSVGLWQVTGLKEAARAEEGNGAKVPDATSFTREGSLKVWTGTTGNGYTTVDLSTYAKPPVGAEQESESWPIFPTEIRYSSEVTLRYSGRVTVQRPKIVSAPAFTAARQVTTQCAVDQCHTTIDSSAAVVASVTVEVLINGTHWTSFSVVSDLGGVTADVTYKAAQDAS